MRDKSLYGLLWGIAAITALVLAGANLFLGELNQDEGWYLYAARLVSLGQKPYIDFASTQGPVMPFVYSLAQPLVDRWGVAGGRFFALLIGLLCSLGTALLAARLSSPGKRNATAFVAFALVAVNVYQSYFFTVVKTYALTALFLVLGFVALTFVNRKQGWIAALLSGVLVSLAAGTRISAAVVLPVVFLVLLWGAWRRRSETGAWTSRMSAAGAFAGGAALTLGLLLVPFWIQAPEGLRFALFDYHAGREVGGLTAALAYKAGFISRVVQDYFVAAGLLLVVVVGFVFGRRRFDEGTDGSLRWMLWGSLGAVTAVHFSAPFPYDDYQVMVYPLLAAVLAVEVGRAFLPSTVGDPATGLGTGALGVTVLLLCVASAFSSPVNQKWFISQRDRIWWPMKTSFPLAVLRDAGNCIRSLTKSDDLLLTQDAYLAVESGRMLPKGMELGPFCYFPDWSREKASRLHVLNREMMIELLESGAATAAAFSGYGLSIRCPEIQPLSAGEQQALWTAVEKRYDLARTIEAFGHAETTLKVYKRK